jgi:pyridinium-3,5-bisthiocarboxylic acid mononucleotide nickel chelatase
MTNIAYLECQTGIAGDMCLGALVDAGVPIEYLTKQLDRLGIATEYQLWAEKIHHNGQIATKVHVDLAAIKSANGHPDHQHRHDAKHDHDHEHTREHSPAAKHDHGHDHSHDHEHPHNHNHDHEHSHDHDHQHHQHGHTHDHDHPAPTSSVVKSTDHHHHDHYDTPQRNLPEIEKLIKAANLPDRVAQWSLAVFHRLAIAEGAVHGIDPSEVHFHEVGAVDAIVDIVGTCIGLDYLDIDKIYCSPLPTGGGTVRAAHGILPVPVPAVLKLCASRQVPMYSNGIDRELVTPTGAAIAVTLATEFGAAPAMQLQNIGLGAGTIELPIPNILRLWLGTVAAVVAPSPVRPDCLETIEVLTTQIDDLNPQAIGYMFDLLFKAGAVDVFTQPIGMKKSRTGILLTVICPFNCSIDCEQIIFQETSTIGIRRTQQMRSILPREIQSVSTKYGTVSVKVARNNLVDDDRIINIQPEYEDCAVIAQAHRISWVEVYQLALMTWHDSNDQR